MDTPTSLPSAAELLAIADTLPVGDRTRLLWRLNTHRRDPALPGLLADLTAHSLFGARLSLTFARFTDAVDHLQALLDHPDAGIAGPAFTVAADHGRLASAIEAALPGQSKAVRLTAYGALRKHRDEDLADRLLPVINDRYGPREAAKLLSACSPATVAAELAVLAPHVDSWSTFAKHHNEEFTAYAAAALAERSPAQWADWWRRHLTALSDAIKQAPAAWLDLLERHPAPAVTDRIVLSCMTTLLAADPERTWAHLLAPGRESLLNAVVRTPALIRRIAAEPPARIAALLRQSGDASATPRLLRRTPPSRRLELIAAVRAAGLHLDDETVLDLLPHPARTEAARRLLGERRVSGDAARRERVRAHLPLDEIRDDLAAATRRSDADARARAYGHLVQAAAMRRDPAAVADLFALLTRAAKDQGVIHERILLGLKAIRPRDWTPDALAALDAFSDACLASPARSTGTVAELLNLTGHLILAGLSAKRPELIAHGECRLDRLSTETPGWGLTNLLRRLPRRIAVALAQRVAPALAVQADVHEYGTALALAGALGRRLGDAPALEPILRRALQSRTASHVNQAMILLTGINRGRHDRLAELAADHPSRPELFAALAVDRCDLLPAWLAAIGEPSPAALQQLLRRWNPQLLGQWPPAVQAAYQEALRRIAADDRRKDHARVDALRVLAQVPGLPLATLAPFLSGDNAQLRAVAVSALHRVTPVDDAWETLPAHLDGDDAAVAAALMERLAQISRPEAIAASAARLLNAPKVTARKQAVRVLSRYRVPGGDDLLRQLWADAALHPSVREAAAAVAADRLAEPWAQALVEDTARFGPDVRASVLALGPDQVPAPFSTRYIELLTTAAADDDPRLQVAGSDGLARWAGHAKEAADALVDFAADLDSGDVWAAAMNALCAIAAAGGDVEPLLRTVGLLDAQAEEQPNAEKDRDLPVRQRFERIVTSLAPEYDRPLIPAAVAAAVADRLPHDLGTRLLARTLDWNPAPEALRALTARIQDPVEAKLIGDAIDQRMLYEVVPDALPFVTALVDLDDRYAAVIAATAIESAASESEWSDPWRELLRRLRAHPSTMVRTLALSVYTSAEYVGASWHA
ncbi:hypothetical protein [Glycomyces sp. NPDC021274]|uniref:hypothetical protein n=1 Tax=Glycomyces sp. NPDC021274 TaxID=3155120 RepID=UPI0033E0576F